MSPLDAAGASGPPTSTCPRSSSRAPAVAAAGGMLKWYEIAEGDEAGPRSRCGARARGAAARPRRRAALAGELGFVILHRCGEGFYFLLVSTWRNENELWETVWAKPGEHEPAFVPWPLDGAPPDVLRLGAPRGLPRAGRLEPLSALGARRATPSRATSRTPTSGFA